MIIAKLNCNEIVVMAQDGRLFVADVRDMSCMTPMEADSPPQEDTTTDTAVPFQPHNIWSFKCLSTPKKPSWLSVKGWKPQPSQFWERMASQSIG